MFVFKNRIKNHNKIFLFLCHQYELFYKKKIIFCKFFFVVARPDKIHSKTYSYSYYNYCMIMHIYLRYVFLSCLIFYIHILIHINSQNIKSVYVCKELNKFLSKVNFLTCFVHLKPVCLYVLFCLRI